MITVNVDLGDRAYPIHIGAGLIGRTQDRLATGLAIKSPIDDAVKYFQAKSLSDRASDLSERKDGIDQGVSTLETVIKATEGIEKLVELNMQAARNTLEENAAHAKAVLSAKGPQELAALQTEYVKPAQEKALAYGRQVYDIAASTQAEVSKLAEAQLATAKEKFTELVDQAAEKAPKGSESAVAAVKTAMANADAAFESVQKAARQAVSLAETNLKTLSETAAKATGRR